MIQKKVCMMGAFAAGKTSLVARFVKSIFSDKYLTTVGVKVDKKSIQIGERDLNLILWDLYGEDEFQKVRLSYLRGSSGYVLVVDGTRRITLDKAILLQKEAEEALGKVPFVLALNILPRDSNRNGLPLYAPDVRLCRTDQGVSVLTPLRTQGFSSDGSLNKCATECEGGAA